MIALGVVVGVVIPGLLILTAPGTMGGGPAEGTPVWPTAFYGLGVAGVIVGLVWMVRIHRADPEPDQHAWRYRAKR